MTSCRMSRPGAIEHGPRNRHLEASSTRRHHGAVRQAVPTPERTMTPVRHKIRALVGEAAIREHSWMLNLDKERAYESSSNGAFASFRLVA